MVVFLTMKCWYGASECTYICLTVDHVVLSIDLWSVVSTDESFSIVCESWFFTEDNNQDVRSYSFCWTRSQRFLDTETHNDLDTNEIAQAVGIVKEKIQRMPRSASTITTTTTTDPTAATTAVLSIPTTPPVSAALSKKDNAKHRMNPLAGVDGIQPHARPMTIDVEILLFTNKIKKHTSFQDFWVKHRASFPRLVYLVHRYFIIPATSVASESAFSISGYIARKQRLSLSSKTLRHLLVLKYRKNLEKFAAVLSPWDDDHCYSLFDLTPFYSVLLSRLIQGFVFLFGYFSPHCQLKTFVCLIIYDVARWKKEWKIKINSSKRIDVICDLLPVIDKPFHLRPLLSCEIGSLEIHKHSYHHRNAWIHSTSTQTTWAVKILVTILGRISMPDFSLLSSIWILDNWLIVMWPRNRSFFQRENIRHMHRNRHTKAVVMHE